MSFDAIVSHGRTRRAVASGAGLAAAGIVLLTGLVLPALGSAHLDPRAKRILDLVERVREAVARHHADTGRFATEYSGPAYRRDRFHELSRRQATPGWRGPYLERPLSSRDNPFGGFVYLYADLEGAAARANGFHLEGENAPLVAGPGQFLALSRVPFAVAIQIDAALDAGVPGPWQRCGRVEYSDALGGTLMVFLAR